jgi:hypothetical protein
MTTVALPLAQATRLHQAFQSSFDTAAPSGFRALEYYSSNLRETQPLEADPFLGTSPQNDLDQRAPGPAVTTHGGTIEVPMDLTQLGWWLRMAFGAPVTTGSNPNYVHTYTSGAATLPTSTFEVRGLSNDWRGHIGCAVTGLAFDMGNGSGRQRARLTFAGRNEAYNTATIAGTPAAVPAADRLDRTMGRVYLDNVQIGSLIAADFEYQPGVVMERYLTTLPYASAAARNEFASASGSLRVRYNAQALDLLGRNKTDVRLDFELIRAANRNLFITAQTCRLEPAGVAISGPGAMEQTLRWRAHVASGSPMLQVVLSNSLAAYT